MKQIVCFIGKTGKKDPYRFFHYLFCRRWGKPFSFGFFYWIQTICYLFYSRSFGRRFKFFIDGNRVLDGFLYGISLLLSNTFCKLGAAWISMIPILWNIFFWYQFKLKNVSVISFFMSFFNQQDCFQCPLGYTNGIIVVVEIVIIYNTFIHI